MLRLFDIPTLGTFVAAAKQDNDFLAPLLEINPIAGAVMDTQLANPWPTGATSPASPLARRKSRAAIIARARWSFSLRSHLRNVSVCPVYGHNPNHNLIRRFLRSAARQLARNGRVIITVVDTPFYSGAFGLMAAAKFAGYKEPDVYEFKPNHFSGYAHANTLGGQSALAKYRNFRSWVFQLP